MTPLMYQWIPNIKRKELALKALEKVWLLHRLNSLPTELSWWEQQRVSIARAIVTEPKLILWDEPTWALDSETWREIMELIVNLNKEWTTIILITHEKNISDYAKIHIWIKDGLIEN
jgi:putative ABC transport system ATP-binding protein